jgi:hypothetical protein
VSIDFNVEMVKSQIFLCNEGRNSSRKNYLIFQVSPERSKTPQSSQLEETTARLSTVSPEMTNNPTCIANATLPKPVAKSSVNSTAPTEAEERPQLKNNSRISAETAAATTSLSTTTITTAAVKSTAASAETASPSRAAAGEKASLSTTYATAAVGGVPELMPTKDDTSSRTTAKKEAIPPPSATETSTAHSKGIAEGTVEEGASPRSRPLKRPIPTPRYVQCTVQVFEEKKHCLISPR